MQHLVMFFCLSVLFSACSDLPTSQEAKLSYATTPITGIPENVEWETIDEAFEILNIKEKVVYFSHGNNPIAANAWEEFEIGLPWAKNLNRNLLFTGTAFLRSPSADVNCSGPDCFTTKDYKGYSWVELAQPLAVDFIPSKTDTKKPAAGHLVIKVIKKCQIVKF